VTGIKNVKNVFLHLWMSSTGHIRVGMQ